MEFGTKLGNYEILSALGKGGSRKTWTTIVFLVVSSMVLAQAAGAQTAPLEEVEASTIEGFVVRSGTGELLRSAEVTLRSEQGSEPLFGALTDSDGRFKLENIVPGNYRLFAEQNGYVDHQYGQVSPSRAGTVLVLAPGQTVTDVVISLVPTGTITGRIFSEAGEPLQGVTVRALRYEYQEGQRVFSRAGLVATNDLGEYRLYWLTPGEYYISAAYEDRFQGLNALREAVVAASPRAASTGAPLPESLDQIYVDTYYPGAIDPAAAAPVRVDPGAQIRAVDFPIYPTRAVTIRGRVVGPFSPEDGVSPNLAIVPRNSRTGNRPGFMGEEGDGQGRNERRRDGSFELTGIAPGPYTIVALVRLGHEDSSGGSQLAGFVDINVGEQDIEGLIVSVEPSLQIDGRMLVDQSVGELNVSGLRVGLRAMTYLPTPGQSARLRDDGSFAFGSVPRAPYRVTVSGLTGNAYLAAVRVGGQDVLASGLQVVPDLPTFEVWISGNGARVDGTVTVDADQVFTGAEVVLVPEDPERTDLYKVTGADQYGRFFIEGIAPGNYRLFAWEDAPSGAYRDPEFVRRYEDWGERIDLEAGAQFRSRPRLIPASE